MIGVSGLLVFFAGEQPALDNSQTGSYLNNPRNLGFVKIPADLSSTAVMSKGPAETGGFYTFGGTWSAQANEGIEWLTANTDDMGRNIARVKTARLG